MKIALIPINVRIGDFEGNLRIHQKKIEEAAKQGASFLIFPELSLVGYSPRDLLTRPGWQEKADAQLEQLHEWLKEKFPKIAVLVGTTQKVQTKEITPKPLANCAIFLQGKRREVRAKTLIPYYDVFWESRYFASAHELDDSFTSPIEWEGKKWGILICEDSWNEQKLAQGKAHQFNPTEALLKKGCETLINISASPFEKGKKNIRREVVGSAAKNSAVPIAYVNHCGAHDDLIYDGDAFLFDAKGNLAGETKFGSGEIILHSFDASKTNPKPKIDSEIFEIHQMLVLGIKDYARKNGFTKAVLGLSGGIDSALVAVLAAEALGPENIVGLAMPSKYSSTHSIDDAEALARKLGISFKHLPIKMAFSTMQMALKPLFQDAKEDITEENLQARIRGVYVMAYSNKFGAMALATGNKSEIAVGYSTLYGDMCGALLPLGDLWKTQVYQLAAWINREEEIIPANTIAKPPSAELRPGQTDQDSLPPYEALDRILDCLVVEELDVAKVSTRAKELGTTIAWIEKVNKMVSKNEFKRFQAAPILRVSKKSFGSGRSYPLTAAW